MLLRVDSTHGVIIRTVGQRAGCGVNTTKDVLKTARLDVPDIK